MTATELFHAKLPTLQAVVHYKASHGHIRRYEEEDVQQMAALRLWTQCIRACAAGEPAFDVSTEIIATGAFWEWAKARKRDLPCLPDFPDHEARRAVLRDGRTTLTLADARMDDPAGCDAWEHGISPVEAAERLGVSRQAVSARLCKLGAVAFRPARGRVEWKVPVASNCSQ